MSSLGLYVLSLLLAAFPPGKVPERETRDDGAKRYEVVAQAIADAALHQGAAWDQGPADLARAMIAAGGMGMGFRRDVHTGELRGPAGEVCHMDLLPSTLRQLVPWDLARLPTPELTSRVVGLDYDSTRRCFDAGALLMVRVRREATKRCKGHPLDYAMFALYATGGSCNTRTAKGDHLAGPRTDLLVKLRARKFVAFPDWYVPPKAERSPES
jgi:hypothetical protein